MLFTPSAQSQPLDDKVTVNMPYTTTIGEKTLPPGDYVIKRMSGLSPNRVLLVYSDEGLKFETSAMTIPVYDPDVARDTKIILSRVGDDYYYDKVWVQGKSYGYQFILPKEARARQRELLAVNASSTGGSSTITTTNTTTAHVTEEPAAPVIAEQPVVEPEPQVETRTEVAQAEPITESPAVAEPDLAPLPENSADRIEEQAPEAPAPVRDEMPATATQWLGMLLGGSSLLGLGLKLRRKA
jgi:hypothetical protein